MAEGSVASGLFAYLAFAALAFVGPGVGVHRLLRLAVEPALVLPIGIACCAASYALARATGVDALFLGILALLNIAGLWPRRGGGAAPGSSWRRALPGAAVIIAVLAATEYPLNARSGGAFVLDPIVPEDSAFHAALAWELTVDGPPQVPGLAGFALDYHQGLPLVRAAARRWAGINPYDSISRFDVTVSAVALALALGAAAAWLPMGRVASMMLPLGLVVTDLGYLFATHPNMDPWIRFCEGSSTFFWLLHANSVVPALAMALGALIAIGRWSAGGGRGWLVLGALLGLALPHFKVFVCAQFLAGLGVAFLLLPSARAGLLWVGLPALAATTALLLSPGSGNIDVALDLFEPARDTLVRIGGEQAQGFALAAWVPLWVLLTLGVRVVGVPLALRSLRGASAPAIALAVMALSGWPLALLLRIQPIADYNRQAAGFNEAQYFILQSAPLLWLFTVAALDRLARSRPAAIAITVGAGLLAFPSTVQFVAFHRADPPVEIPATIVRASDALAAVSRPGDVVLIDPRPRRYPPPPLVFSALRVTYTNSIPWLTQFASREAVDGRRADVRTFFSTTDPKEALAAARRMGATYAALYGSEELQFPPGDVLLPLITRPNVRIYLIATGEESVR